MLNVAHYHMDPSQGPGRDQRRSNAVDPPPRTSIALMAL
jgi:hypothetical protein